MIDASRLFAVVPSFLIHNRNSLYKNTVTKIYYPSKGSIPSKEQCRLRGEEKGQLEKIFFRISKTKIWKK